MFFSNSMMLRTASLCCFILLIQASPKKVWNDEEETPEYWYNLAKEELDLALELEQDNTNVARNVIIMLGDGMGIPTITTGRILKGQMQGKPGEDAELAMDKFPHVGLSKTYSVDKQVSDSACTATAYLCGVKANYNTIGVSGAARRLNCSSTQGNEVDSVLVDAYRAGKSTGVVTTTRINHATPAGTYAHTPYRQWYGDKDLPEEAKQNGCKDIAQQFYDQSDMITVALGGGRKYFLPSNRRDPEYRVLSGAREDGQHLINQWLDKQNAKGFKAEYVWNQGDFDNVDPVTTDRLLGLFQPDDMWMDTDRVKLDRDGEPSLAEMTEKAIRMLQKNSNGYFLLVEGGRIDHGHHMSNAYAALHEMVAFDKAVATAAELTSESDTLIIVTADHGHTFNFGGYTDRGNPLFGLAYSEGELEIALDNKPYTSLLYGNGIGSQGLSSVIIDPHSRADLTTVNTERRTYFQQTAVPLVSETHGGEDVAILARGPMSHLIHGVHQQSYIAYVMRYASCIGSDLRHCGEYASGGDPIQTTTKFNPIQTTTTVQTNPAVSSTASSFLGMGLTLTETEVALNVMFTLLICMIVFAIVISSIAIHSRSQKKKISPLIESEG